MIPETLHSMLLARVVRTVFGWMRRHFVASFILFFTIGLVIYGVRGMVEEADFKKNAERVDATIVSSEYDFEAQHVVIISEATLQSGEHKQFTTFIDGSNTRLFTPGSKQEAYYTADTPDTLHFLRGQYVIQLILALIFGAVVVVYEVKKAKGEEM